MPLALVMTSLETAPSNGARLVTTDGRELPLTGTQIRADAAGGIARTVVEQRFENPYAEALAVTYSLPLPSDGAVSGFAFRIGGRRVQGEVQRRAEAREMYERALASGRSAALLEQDRSSLFTQEIGNIPPGEAVVAEITVDQPLRWLDEGAWEWRFPTVVSPRYLGEAGRVPDAARVAQDVAAGPLGARFTLSCTVRDALAEGREPESPSHAMTVEGGRAQSASYRTAGGREPGGARAVTMRIDQGARLDRDVVVRWMVAAPAVGVSLSVGRPSVHEPHSDRAYGLLTIVPPSAAVAKSGPRSGPVPAKVARDLVVLLDTSGSMGGEPLEQARRVVSALIDTLGPNDQLEMVEFSNEARRWQKAPVAVTNAAKRAALSWLRGLSASGGTDMVSGILEAMRGLRPEAQRQVVVVTDGQIGFESQVIAAICDQLPAGSRLHTVGVGSGVNRSLTGPAARAGRGVEVIIGLGEDPERAAARLVARTNAPLVVDLAIAGSALVEHAPRRLPDLFAGAPALVGLALRPEGGEILVSGRTATGRWEQRLAIEPVGAGSGSTAVVALYGREGIEDCELAVAAGGDRRELDARIEKTGLDFQLATRLTSWIAVTKEVTVDPREGLRRERMPHELPYGVSAEGLGLRPAQETLDQPMPMLHDVDSEFEEVKAAPAAKLAEPVYFSAQPPSPPAASSAPVLHARLGKTSPKLEIAHLEVAASRKRSSAPILLLGIVTALIASGLAYAILRDVTISAAIALAVILLHIVLARLLR